LLFTIYLALNQLFVMSMYVSSNEWINRHRYSYLHPYSTYLVKSDYDKGGVLKNIMDILFAAPRRATARSEAANV